MGSRRMLQTMAAAAALAAASCVGASAFLLPATRLLSGASAPLAAGRGQAPLRASAAAGVVPPVRSDSNHVSALFLGGLLAGAAALARRSERRRLARHVTLQDIQALTITDVPTHWRPKVSIGQARRNSIVMAVKRQLEQTFFVLAFNRDVMTWKQMEGARALFPESVTVRVIKNTLVQKAMEGTNWAPFSERLKGSNMYVFVEKDKDLKETIEAFIKMDKKYTRQAVLDKVKEKNPGGWTFELRSLVGGIMADEWNVIEPADLPKFKDFPTKTELIARIAGSIKQVSTKIAKGIKMVPTKLAIGLKKTVEKGEEDGKGTVGAVAV